MTNLTTKQKTVHKIVRFLKELFENPYTECNCEGCRTGMPGWETEEYKRKYRCTRRLK